MSACPVGGKYCTNLRTFLLLPIALGESTSISFAWCNPRGVYRPLCPSRLDLKKTSLGLVVYCENQLKPFGPLKKGCKMAKLWHIFIWKVPSRVRGGCRSNWRALGSIKCLSRAADWAPRPADIYCLAGMMFCLFKLNLSIFGWSMAAVCHNSGTPHVFLFLAPLHIHWRHLSVFLVLYCESW